MAKEEKGEDKIKLAIASIDGSMPTDGGFFMPGSYQSTGQRLGVFPEKLIVPSEYHALIQMCWDFYLRGSMASVVVDRIAELAITEIRNGQRKTSNEANIYYDALLHRKPSRLYRYIFQMALEYFITGMVLPKVEWKKVKGEDVHPGLQKSKEYMFPQFDMYPPLLIDVEWVSWGRKAFYYNIPSKDVTLIKSGGSNLRTTEQKKRYEQLQEFPQILEAVKSGANRIKLDVDPILRKENSLNPYPIPYLSKVLEALVFKQQLRRMDFAVASRIINAILLVQEGDADFPITEDDRGNLDNLKAQILARANNPALLERLFILFSNHTTKLTWIHPDVEALLNQDKYRQSNDEIMEGLGFPRILVVGESRGAQAAEVSTWAIQPQMEQLRLMILEWMQELYEEAAELNGFRNTPKASFTPIRLQDFVKTAAVFAQLYKEGNVSRTTRDQGAGLDFETEVELMNDEIELIRTLPKDFPEMPYNTQVVPAKNLNPTGIGAGNQKSNPGKKVGTTNRPVTKKNSGVSIDGQRPVSRTSPSGDSTRSRAAAEQFVDAELWPDEDVLELLNKIAEERGLYITPEDI